VAFATSSGTSSDSDAELRRSAAVGADGSATATADGTSTALAVTARRGKRARTGAAADVEGDADADTVAPDRRLFAVIALGGTQYKVTQGDIINAERIPSAVVGTTITIDGVLAVGNQSRSVIGRPTVPTFHVVAAVEEHADDAKVTVFKMRRRKRYMRTKGHRRMVTRLRVVDIAGDMGAL